MHKEWQAQTRCVFAAMYIVVASSTKIDCKTRNMLQVLMAGGVPSYLVHDMTTTPRTSGTLILTTHALYWRPNVMRQIFSRSSEKSAKGKLKRFELRHTTTTSTVDEAQAQSEDGFAIDAAALEAAKAREPRPQT